MIKSRMGILLTHNCTVAHTIILPDIVYAVTLTKEVDALIGTEQEAISLTTLHFDSNEDSKPSKLTS